MVTRRRTATAKAILDFFNPVLDLDKDLKLHGAIRVNAIELGQGVASLGCRQDPGSAYGPAER